MKVICQYCGQCAQLVDSAEVYHGVSYGRIWICRPCGAWVGVHHGTIRPKGVLANAELRTWKQKAHATFDPHWRGKGKDVRTKSYNALAQVLGMTRETCHIGEMSVNDCQRVIEACEWGLLGDLL